MKNFFLFLALCLSFKGVDSFSWNTTYNVSTIYACSHATVLFPFYYNLDEGETYDPLTWNIIERNSSIRVIAMSTENGPLVNPELEGRARAYEDGSLEVYNVTVSDSKVYSFDIEIHKEDEPNITFTRNYDLLVSDRAMHTGEAMVGGMKKTAKWDAEKEEFVVELWCGHFIFKDDVLSFYDVEWTRDDGTVFNSTGYKNGEFLLQLSNPVNGGAYKCAIPVEALDKFCAFEEIALSVDIEVDEGDVRDTLLEAEVKALKDKVKQQQQLIDGLLSCCDGDSGYIPHKTPNSNSSLDNYGQTPFVHRKRDPCTSGSTIVLDDYTRSIAYTDGKGRCDLRAFNFDDFRWYRFTQNGRNAMVPNACPRENACGAPVPMWLMMDNTDLLKKMKKGQEVNAQACGRFNDDCCNYKSSTATIRACDGYFVYKLKPDKHCNLRYCSHVEN